MAEALGWIFVIFIILGIAFGTLFLILYFVNRCPNAKKLGFFILQKKLLNRPPRCRLAAIIHHVV